MKPQEYETKRSWILFIWKNFLNDGPFKKKRRFFSNSSGSVRQISKSYGTLKILHLKLNLQCIISYFACIVVCTVTSV